MEDYNILKRPATSPSHPPEEENINEISQESVQSKDFGSELDSYIELSTRSDNKTWEDWILDPSTGYYYNAEKKLYSYWDPDSQTWSYIDYSTVCEAQQNHVDKPSGLSPHADIGNTEGELEEGEVPPEGLPLESLTLGNQYSYPIPPDFHPTSTPPYFYNHASDLWYDASTAIYSRYDEASQIYIPVELSTTHDLDYSEQPPLPDDEPFSDSTLRLVVLESGMLKEGQLVLVDANGISVGRDRAYERRLRLAEMETSKFHCQIYLDATKESEKDSSPHFCIVDMGSQNGTFVNSTRLSQSKTSSSPYPIKHLDIIQIGSSRFQVHQHDSGLACEKCVVQEGNVIDVNPSGENTNAKVKDKGILLAGTQLNQRDVLEIERIAELKRLKRKYTDASNGNTANKQLYRDRAKERRKFIPDKTPTSSLRPTPPPLPPDQPSVVTLNTKISSDNVGSRMLQKMGWREGQSLGKDGEDGILEPIRVEANDGRIGLGAIKKNVGAAISASEETFAEQTRRVARERFRDMS